MENSGTNETWKWRDEEGGVGPGGGFQLETKDGKERMKEG